MSTTLNGPRAKKTLVQLEGKQGVRGPDFDDDGYKCMICVEPAVARPSAPVELAIGESWTEARRGAFVVVLSRINYMKMLWIHVRR